MSHACNALVLTCIDFRFHNQLEKLLQDKVCQSFDLKTDAGAVKQLVSGKAAVRDWILQNIEIARKLHQIKKVVLVNHRDCGAYGGDAAFANHRAQVNFHKNQLEEATKIIQEKFPDLKVETYFAELEGEKVSLKKI